MSYTTNDPQAEYQRRNRSPNWLLIIAAVVFAVLMIQVIDTVFNG